MPSADQEPGFLPACPTPRSPDKTRMTSSGRTNKARAVEMDEALDMSHQMKNKFENMNKKQHLATMKVKEAKSNAKTLKEKVGSMEAELENARVEAEKNRIDPEVKARYDKLQGDHATLQATHAWTKSSLDSTLAAQEEYRKGYTSLQTAFKKAKEDLARKQKQADTAKEAHQDFLTLQASLPEKEKEFQEDLRDAQEALKNIMARQKKRSKAVLDKMLAGQSSTLMQLTLQNWSKVISDEKFWRENAKALEAAQGKLKEYQARKKNEASKVLDRMSAANETGLLGMMMMYWSKYHEEAKKERAEAAQLQSTLVNAKLAARKTLEQNLGSNATGILTMALKDWINYFKENKKVSEMKEKAEAKLKEYQSQKKGQSSSVIERMSGQQTQALILQVFICWAMSALDESAARHAVNDLTNKVDDLESILQGLKDEIAQCDEDIEDTNEEISESRRKNGLLKEEFASILNIQHNMDSSMKEMDED